MYFWTLNIQTKVPWYLSNRCYYYFHCRPTNSMIFPRSVIVRMVNKFGLHVNTMTILTYPIVHSHSPAAHSNHFKSRLRTFFTNIRLYAQFLVANHNARQFIWLRKINYTVGEFDAAIWRQWFCYFHVLKWINKLLKSVRNTSEHKCADFLTSFLLPFDCKNVNWSRTSLVVMILPRSTSSDVKM